MVKDCISILIAEDDADDLFICHEALKSTHYRYCLAHATTGRELIEMLTGKGKFQNLEQLHPDILILDINMPVMDGLDALKYLVRTKSLEDIKIYVLSTSSNPEHRVRAQDLGAIKFFCKPHTMKGFEDIFQEIVQDL
jgi:CheY-like chemotaxis protein